MKLSREPCARCAADTLHKASVCTICGEVAHRHLDRVIERRAKAAAYYGKLTRQYGKRYDPVLARAKRTGEIGMYESFKAQNAEAKTKLGPDHDDRHEGTFGRGRERTKA